jgi:hypothetical protein
MALLNCNTNTALLAAIAILFVAFTNDILTTAPIIKKLFTDKINFALLVLLGVLILLLHLPSGIILTFLILYVSVYISHQARRSNFANVMTEPSLDAMLGEGIQGLPLSKIVTSESEFTYDHSKKPAVINLPPFMLKSDDEIKNASPVSAMPCDAPRVLAPVANPNRDGYDVAGCRYDYQDTEQNLFKNGPPLASCGAYSIDQFNKVGTLFYPLNA